MIIRRICFVALAAVLCSPLFAQSASTPNAADIGKDQAQQLLKEVSVTKLEDASFWSGSMFLDNGVIALRRMEGSPQGKKPLEDEQALGIKEGDTNVLAAKVVFFHRAVTDFVIAPVNPIPIEGIVKTISVWVVGRNFNHTLKVIVEDYMGRQLELTMGRLNFMGWKQMVVAVPPSILQSEHHYTNKSGLKLLGFKVECDLMESYGTFYVYLDDVRAVTDLFGEAKRDVDDMVDSW
jgi:hypothetical protein